MLYKVNAMAEYSFSLNSNALNRNVTLAAIFFIVLTIQPLVTSVGAFSFVLSSAAAADNAVSPYLPHKVAVAGATGRTGSLVVAELVQRKIEVVALVRDTEKALELLPSSVTCVQCNLESEDEIRGAVAGCDAAVWCATGFSDAPSSAWDKVKAVFNVAVTPKRSIDYVGVPALARAMQQQQDAAVTNNGDDDTAPSYPKVVMLSSAGVTRPSWDDNKKKLFEGAADIPIVRLNPFGILDIKAESEQKLRETGVDYCVVRPCGLNDAWPAKSRPIFSQGDVAVGRINRSDVADLLVDVLSSPAAVGKTFEAVTMTGYPPAPSIEKAMSGLLPDTAGIPSNEMLGVTYAMMQQLLPGEKQDSAALAMGQTYEELDVGKTGRLGERGKEDAEMAAPKPTS